MTVLVVDDNDTYRADLIDFLQKQDGVQIVGQARDGLEAMSLTHTLHPDLVMIDTHTPCSVGRCAQGSEGVPHLVPTNDKGT